MKIGIISIMEGYKWGGSEELWVQFAISGVKAQHEVVASLKYWDPLHDKVKSLIDRGVKIHLRKYLTGKPVTFWERLQNRLSPPDVPQYFLSLFEENPDLLLISEGGFSNILAFPELLQHLRNFGKPYFILSQFNYDFGTIHNNDLLNARTVYGQADKLFFVSLRNKVSAERQLALDLKKAVVVRNPVNLEYPDYVPFPNKDILEFAVVARFECNKKGQDLLLEALSCEKWIKRDFQLNLYGEGPDEDYLKLLVQKFNLGDKVNFCGMQQQVNEIWKNNHLLVLPSIAEGTPLALVEAMLCGRCAVVTDVAGHTEWVENNNSGFISPSYHPHYLDEALERAWQNKSDFEEFGLRARKSALKLYASNPGRELLNQMLQNV